MDKMPYMYIVFVINLFIHLTCGYVRVCYYTNWSQYRAGIAKFVPENIDPELCTHLVYAFAKLKGNRLAPVEWNDDKTAWSKGMYSRFNDLKIQNPSLKTLLAVGGWNFGSKPFSDMTSSAKNRRTFINSALKYLRKRKFDGLDIDWEYPAARGGPPQDKANFAALMKELKTAFEIEAKSSKKDRLLLSMAVPADQEKINNGYDIPVLTKAVDLINIMTYDFHGAWDPITGHNSPLYPKSSDFSYAAQKNIKWVTDHWLANGASRDKMVIGFPLFGRGFTLQDQEVFGIGSEAISGSIAGPFTKEIGYIAYFEVCKMIEEGAKLYRDEEQRVPYLVKGDQWIGYDDQQSFTEKVNWVKDNQFAGVMLWSLDLDDFTGKACKPGTKYPMLKTIKHVLESNNIPVQKNTTTTSTPITSSEQSTEAPNSPRAEISSVTIDTKLALQQTTETTTLVKSESYTETPKTTNIRGSTTIKPLPETSDSTTLRLPLQTTNGSTPTETIITTAVSETTTIKHLSPSAPENKIMKKDNTLELRWDSSSIKASDIVSKNNSSLNKTGNKNETLNKKRKLADENSNLKDGTPQETSNGIKDSMVEDEITKFEINITKADNTFEKARTQKNSEGSEVNKTEQKSTSLSQINIKNETNDYVNQTDNSKDTFIHTGKSEPLNLSQAEATKRTTNSKNTSIHAEKSEPLKLSQAEATEGTNNSRNTSVHAEKSEQLKLSQAEATERTTNSTNKVTRTTTVVERKVSRLTKEQIREKRRRILEARRRLRRRRKNKPRKKETLKPEQIDETNNRTKRSEAFDFAPTFQKRRLLQVNEGTGQGDRGGAMTSVLGPLMNIVSSFVSSNRRTGNTQNEPELPNTRRRVEPNIQRRREQENINPRRREQEQIITRRREQTQVNSRRREQEPIAPSRREQEPTVSRRREQGASPTRRRIDVSALSPEQRRKLVEEIERQRSSMRVQQNTNSGRTITRTRTRPQTRQKERATNVQSDTNLSRAGGRRQNEESPIRPPGVSNNIETNGPPRNGFVRFNNGRATLPNRISRDRQVVPTNQPSPLLVQNQRRQSFIANDSPRQQSMARGRPAQPGNRRNIIETLPSPRNTQSLVQSGLNALNRNDVNDRANAVLTSQNTGASDQRNPQKEQVLSQISDSQGIQFNPTDLARIRTALDQARQSPMPPASNTQNRISTPVNPEQTNNILMVQNTGTVGQSDPQIERAINQISDSQGIQFNPTDLARIRTALNQARQKSGNTLSNREPQVVRVVGTTVQPLNILEMGNSIVPRIPSSRVDLDVNGRTRFSNSRIRGPVNLLPRTNTLQPSDTNRIIDSGQQSFLQNPSRNQPEINLAVEPNVTARRISPIDLLNFQRTIQNQQDNSVLNSLKPNGIADIFQQTGVMTNDLPNNEVKNAPVVNGPFPFRGLSRLQNAPGSSFASRGMKPTNDISPNDNILMRRPGREPNILTLSNAFSRAQLSRRLPPNTVQQSPDPMMGNDLRLDDLQLSPGPIQQNVNSVLGQLQQFQADTSSLLEPQANFNFMSPDVPQIIMTTPIPIPTTTMAAPVKKRKSKGVIGLLREQFPQLSSDQINQLNQEIQKQVQIVKSQFAGQLQKNLIENSSPKMTLAGDMVTKNNMKKVKAILTNAIKENQKSNNIISNSIDSEINSLQIKSPTTVGKQAVESTKTPGEAIHQIKGLQMLSKQMESNKNINADATLDLEKLRQELIRSGLPRNLVIQINPLPLLEQRARSGLSPLSQSQQNDITPTAQNLGIRNIIPTSRPKISPRRNINTLVKQTQSRQLPTIPLQALSPVSTEQPKTEAIQSPHQLLLGNQEKMALQMSELPSTPPTSPRQQMIASNQTVVLTSKASSNIPLPKSEVLWKWQL